VESAVEKQVEIYSAFTKHNLRIELGNRKSTAKLIRLHQ
jgi:hypothetical protein